MKIVILTSMFPPKWLGGVEIATQDIARQLARHGHQVHVITSQDPGLPKESQEEGFFLHRIKYPKIPFLGSIMFGCRIFFMLKKIRPDIVHCQRIQMGIGAFVYKKCYQKPYIVWCHGDDVYFPWKCKKIISKLVLNSASAVIALTYNMQTKLKETFKGTISILPNGISMEKFQGLLREDTREKLKITPNEKIILFVGGLKSIKGVTYLIEAFKTVNQEFKDTRLLLVGQGEERQNLQNLAKMSGLEEKVHFLGSLPNEKALEYMVASDIFVLPSVFETFGIVNLEAMACGLPVVATNVYGIPEVITDGVNGFLVEPKNSDQLAQKIFFLFNNAELREKISENNIKKARQYDWTNIIIKLENIYREAVKN